MSLNIFPIKKINNLYCSKDDKEISFDEAISRLEGDGYKKNYKQINIGLAILIYFISFIFVYISPIVYLWKGIAKHVKNNTIYEKIIQIPIYKPDRRFKTGVRHIGYENKKLKFKVNATDEDKSKYKKRGFLYLAMCVSLVLFNIYIFTKI